jgi:hypothetical protein
MKLGPISIGLAADGQQFGVVPEFSLIHLVEYFGKRRPT